MGEKSWRLKIVQELWRKNAHRKFEFFYSKRAIVGIIGGTLQVNQLFLKLLREGKANTGKVSLGKTVNLGYVDQSRDCYKRKNGLGRNPTETNLYKSENMKRYPEVTWGVSISRMDSRNSSKILAERETDCILPNY